MEKTAASAILRSDDVTEDVGHLYKVEKTAASAILKNGDVTEDNERDQEMGAGRRSVFPVSGQNDQNLKSTRYWENLLQSSQEGHLSKPEQFQNDMRTFPNE